MAGMSVSGLSSGLNTDAIIAQLMDVERQPRTRLDLRSRQASSRQTSLQDLQGKLAALQTAVANLKSTTLFSNTQTVTSSDPTRVAALRTTGAPAGGFTIDVTRLASAAYATGTWAAPAAATTLTADGHDTAIAAGASVDDAVVAVNSDSAATVWASNVAGQLVLSHRQTGSAALTVSSSALSGVTTVAGQQASYSVNGGAAQASDSNEIANAIPGVTLTLKSTTSGSVTVNVGVPGPDPDAITAKMKAFVDSYNAAIDAIKAKTEEQKVVKPATDADRMKGLLQGDSMLTSVLSQLRIAIGSPVAGLPDAMNELADLGISTGAASGAARFADDSVTGHLKFDETKFRAALATDPTGVKTVLGATTAGGGVGAALAGVLDPVLKTDGVIDARLKSTKTQVSDLGKQMAAMDDRLALKEQSYRAMFTRLETALSQSQAQQQWLSGQIAALG